MTLQELKREAAANIELISGLTTRIGELRSPPPGPYALFHYASSAIERIRDVQRILERLYEGRARMTELDAGSAVSPSDVDLDGRMKLDLESLYVFGWVLLDQWSLLAREATGATFKGDYPFGRMIDSLDEPASRLARVAEAAGRDMIWLFYQLRVVRNTFVVHSDRPWQRGTNRSVGGDSFHFFIPKPVAWPVPDDSLARVAMLRAAAPPRVASQLARVEQSRGVAPADVLDRMLDAIDEIEDVSVRDEVYSLFRILGGATATFQIIGERIMRFVRAGTETLAELVEESPEAISLDGISHVDAGLPTFSPEPEG